MSLLKTSWSGMDRSIADVYLDGYGHPSPRSKALVASLLKETFGSDKFRLADFGCGNGHLCAYVRGQGLTCDYFGYDFSTVLLDAGRARFPSDESVHFIEADIQDPDMPGEKADVVLFSHVLEMLDAPEKSLRAAKGLSPLVMVRFFEPPDHQFDLAEVRMMELGGGKPQAPYLRRSMSRAYYDLILHAVGCKRVDVHQVDGDKDQVHMLRFD